MGNWRFSRVHNRLRGDLHGFLLPRKLGHILFYYFLRNERWTLIHNTFCPLWFSLSVTIRGDVPGHQPLTRLAFAFLRRETQPQAPQETTDDLLINNKLKKTPEPCQSAKVMGPRYSFGGSQFSDQSEHTRSCEAH